MLEKAAFSEGLSVRDGNDVTQGSSVTVRLTYKAKLLRTTAPCLPYVPRTPFKA